MRDAGALPAHAAGPGTQHVWHSYTQGERIADGVIQLLGVSAAAIAGIVLASAGHGSAGLAGAAALGLYAAGLFTMMACSALYNLAGEGPRKELLRRLDHAAIFAMIAGTYTPVSIIGIGGAWGWGLLAVVWTGALAGGVLKLWMPARFEGASIVAYLLLGWAGLAAIGPLVAALPAREVALLAAGGLFYSVGVAMHLATRVPYHNAVWHGLVLAGAACHFVAIYNLGAGVAVRG